MQGGKTIEAVIAVGFGQQDARHVATELVLDDALQALPGPGALPLLRRFHLHLGLFKTRMSRSTCQGSVLASKEFVSLMMPTPVCTPVRLSATVAIYHDLQRETLPWTLCQCLVGSLQNCGF